MCRDNSLKVSFVMVKTVKREIKLVSIKRKSFSDPAKGVNVARRIISSGQNCVEIFL